MTTTSARSGTVTSRLYVSDDVLAAGFRGSASISSRVREVAGDEPCRRLVRGRRVDRLAVGTTWPDKPLAAHAAPADPSTVEEPLIERTEVVALLLNVSDIARSLTGSNDCWKRTMAKKKLTEAERTEWEAQPAQMLANAQRTRELAERAQAKLDAKTTQK
jgi:hypothetical protein